MERFYRRQALVPQPSWQSLTLTSIAQSLTVPSHALIGFARLEGGNARWRDDGTSPTSLSSGGTILYADETLELDQNLGMVQFILTSGTPVLTVAYYGHQ